MRTSPGSGTQTANHKSPLSDERADHYLAVARETTKRLASASIVWCLALLVSFVAINTDLSKRIEDVTKSIATQSNLLRQKEKVEEARSKDTKNSQADKAKTEEKLALLEHDIESEKRAALTSLRSQVSISLPGLSTIPINPPLAPVLWILLASIVLGHLASLREKAHSFLLTALRHTPRERRGKPVMPPPTTLLAPMPVKGTAEVSTLDYFSAYGDPFSLNVSRLPVLLLMVALVGAQFWMLWVQSTLQPMFILTRLKVATQVFSMLCIGATVVTCYMWLRPWNLSDRETHDSMPSSQRRHFLRVAVGSVVIAGATHVIVRKTPTVRLARKLVRPAFAVLRWKPRFKTRKRPENLFVSLPAGLALNTKSGIVHVVVETLALREPAPSEAEVRPRLRDRRAARKNKLIELNASQAVRVDRFKHVDDPKGLFIRQAGDDKRTLRRSTVPQAFEAANVHNGPSFEQFQRAAMAALAQDLAYKRKAQLMNRGGAKQRTPMGKKRKDGLVPAVDTQLYDNIARSAMLAGRRDAIEALIAFVKANGLSDSFARRFQNWQNPGSKWSKKNTPVPAMPMETLRPLAR